MPEESVTRILERLRSSHPHAAWSDFLQEYSPIILQAVRRLERDEDHVSDCFLFVCEQLSRDRFKRLKRFRIDGPASFATWLQVVVRNLCLDWHRKEFGRERVFQSVARLSPFDQEVFHCLYEFGATAEESALLLAPRFPGINPQKVHESIERIKNALSSRQQWLLSSRRLSRARRATEPENEGGPELIPDSQPSPESQAELQEQLVRLGQALESLSPRDRLLLQFRFEEELTLDEIAQLMDLGGAQRADRHIRELLERLKEKLG